MIVFIFYKESCKNVKNILEIIFGEKKLHVSQIKKEIEETS